MANEEYSIVERVLAQFRGINGTGNYNFDVSDYVYGEEKLLEEITRFPSICISNIELNESRQKNRSRFDVPIVIEGVGFIKHTTEPLNEALKLLSDMRNSITTDEWLNDQVDELTFSSDVGVLNGIGIIIFRINCVVGVAR